MQIVLGPEELKDRYYLAINTKGVHPEDIAVVLDGDQIVVEFEKEFDPDKIAFTNWDKAYGIFTRRFQLPTDVDIENIVYSNEGDQLVVELQKFAEVRAREDLAPSDYTAPHLRDVQM